jgi:hypothetical protein
MAGVVPEAPTAAVSSSWCPGELTVGSLARSGVQDPAAVSMISHTPLSVRTLDPAVNVGAVLFKHAGADQIAEFLARTARQDHVARWPGGVRRHSVRIIAVAIIDAAEHEQRLGSKPRAITDPAKRAAEFVLSLLCAEA